MRRFEPAVAMPVATARAVVRGGAGLAPDGHNLREDALPPEGAVMAVPEDLPTVRRASRGAHPEAPRKGA
jgi:hypothetical protein